MDYDEQIAKELANIERLKNEIRLLNLKNYLFHYFPYDLLFTSVKDKILINITKKSSLTNDEYKPILRNYKNISKDIQHNGQNFNPLIEIVKMITGAKTVTKIEGAVRNLYYFKCEFEETCDEPQTLIMTENFDVWYQEFHLNKHSRSLMDVHLITLKLFEWKFDMPHFDFIKNGLAYDFEIIALYKTKHENNDN